MSLSEPELTARPWFEFSSNKLIFVTENRGIIKIIKIHLIQIEWSDSELGFGVRDV